MSPEPLSSRWLEVTVTVAAESAEAVGAELIHLGAHGFVTADPGRAPGDTRSLVAYFPEPSPVEALKGFLQDLPRWGLDPGPAEVVVRPVDEADWRDQWKAFFHPTRVGRHLLIHPPWEVPAEVRPGDVTIVIDPGQAFGTGNHATTRGALELLEEAMDQVPSPLRAIDLGTGSGILAIAAAKLGAGRVTAVDNDPIAVAAARENIERNGVSSRVDVAAGDAFEALARPEGPAVPPVEGALPADVQLILANLTTGLVTALVRPAAALLPAGGFLVCAGVSTGEGSEAVAYAAGEAGLVEVSRREAEGWTSFLFGRAAEGYHRKPRAVFHTLGCKANLYDTAGMMDELRRAGWEVRAGGKLEESREAGAGEGAGADSGAGSAEPLDLCVINSCAVTARAESKSRQLARKVKRENPGALVALVGCYPEVRREEAAAAAGVDLVLGTGDRSLLLDILRERGLAPRRGRERRPVTSGENGPSVVPGAFVGERTRATVKVQDGCEQFCTYCVIPYARGPSRSRPAAEVVDEVARLVRTGFKEVVVTGIHLGAWGLDLGRLRLADLVRELTAIPGLARVRLSSIEPLEVDEDLIEMMATSPRLCRHLHIPLQSGSDAVLERMNRHYTGSEYLSVVEKVRGCVPLVGITTDVMVGFPGETDEDFARTLEVVERARFSRLHVFRFSRRPGTPAADLPGQVPAAVKKARSEELIRLGRRLGRDFRESLLGQTMEVLVEREVGGFVAGAGPAGEGFTDNYVRVVFSGPNTRPNELVPVVLEEAVTEGMRGRQAPTRSP